MLAVKKLNVVKEVLERMKKDQYSLKKSLQLTPSELIWVKRDLGEKDVLTRSLTEAAKAKKHGRERQSRKQEKATKRRLYDFCVRNCFYDFVRVVHDRVLKYAELDTSELCFELERMAQSLKHRSKTGEKSGEGSVFEVAKKKCFNGVLCSWRRR